MGNFEGISDTQFIGAGEFGAVTSYRPCHLFADPMLIGTGIRTAFYLLYSAAILAVLLGAPAHFPLWHASWATIALALLVAVAANTAAANTNYLLLVDWTILLQLVLWYPVFLLLAVLLRPGYHHQRHSLGERTTSPQAIQARLTTTLNAALSARDAALSRAYADALRAHALAALASDTEDRYLQAQRDLAAATRTFILYSQQQVDVVDDSPSHHHEEHTTTTTIAQARIYDPSVIAHIAATNPTRSDVLLLRTLYIASLVQRTKDEATARATERELAILVSEQELRLERRALPPAQALRSFLLASSPRDRTAAALALLVWSAYMFATPALYFSPQLWDSGRKAGCDDNIYILFVLAPKRPYVDDGFRTFLKVWTVGVVIVAVLTTVLACFLLFMTVFDVRPRRARAAPRTRKSKTRGADDNDGDDLAAVRGGDEEQATAAGGEEPYDPAFSTSSSSRRARRKNADEILDYIHNPRQSRSPTTTVGAINHLHSRRPKPHLHLSISNIPWALLLAVLLVETIATVELTIRIDNMDFVRAPMHESAELLAFFIGAFALVMVVLGVVRGLVAFLKRRRRERSLGDRSHEQHGGEKTA